MSPTQPSIEPFLWTGGNVFVAEAGLLPIAFMTVEDGRAVLSVYASDGERLAVLFDRRIQGWTWNAAAWDGRNDRGGRCASGVYVLRLSTPHREIVRTVGLVR